jgi:hypothetical protein
VGLEMEKRPWHVTRLTIDHISPLIWA